MNFLKIYIKFLLWIIGLCFLWVFDLVYGSLFYTSFLSTFNLKETTLIPLFKTFTPFIIFIFISVHIFEFGREYERNQKPKNKFDAVKSFLNKKLKQAQRMMKDKNLTKKDVGLWGEQLFEGLSIAHGGGQFPREIELSWNIIINNIRASSMYNQDLEKLRKTLDDCMGQLVLIVSDVKPYFLKENFDPIDLKNFE